MKKIRIYSSALKGSMNMLIEKGANLSIGEQIEGQSVQHIDHLGTYDAIYFNGILKRDFSMGEEVAVKTLPDSIRFITPINNVESVRSNLKLQADLEKANARANREIAIISSINDKLSRLNEL